MRKIFLKKFFFKKINEKRKTNGKKKIAEMPISYVFRRRERKRFLHGQEVVCRIFCLEMRQLVLIRAMKSGKREENFSNKIHIGSF